MSTNKYAMLPSGQCGPIAPPPPYQKIEKNIERKYSAMTKADANKRGVQVRPRLFFENFSAKKPNNPQKVEVIKTQRVKITERIMIATLFFSIPNESRGYSDHSHQKM